MPLKSLIKSVKDLSLMTLFVCLTSSYPMGVLAAGDNGGANGGGGHGTLCGSEVKLLDHSQLQNQWKDLTLDMGDEHLTVDQVLEKVLSRLEKVNPDRAKLYREKIAEMRNPSNFIRMGYTSTHDDSGLFIPPGCHDDLTIAFQMAPQFPGDKAFNFNLDLTEKMKDPRELAGLFLHEAIEWEALNNRFHDSAENTTDHTLVRRVAHFNDFISSSQMNGISLQDYVEHVEDSLLLRSFELRFGITGYILLGYSDRATFYSPNRVRTSPQVDGSHVVTFPLKNQMIHAWLEKSFSFYQEQKLLQRHVLGECDNPNAFTPTEGIPCAFSLADSAKDGTTFEWGTVFVQDAHISNFVMVFVSTINDNIYLAANDDLAGKIVVRDLGGKEISCLDRAIQVNTKTREVSCFQL